MEINHSCSHKRTEGREGLSQVNPSLPHFQLLPHIEIVLMIGHYRTQPTRLSLYMPCSVVMVSFVYPMDCDEEVMIVSMFDKSR